MEADHAREEEGEIHPRRVIESNVDLQHFRSCRRTPVPPVLVDQKVGNRIRQALAVASVYGRAAGLPTGTSNERVAVARSEDRQ